MSVTDSRSDRAAAEARVAAADEEQLLRDLTYWSVAAQDERHAFHDLTEELSASKARYAEATTWIEIVTEEMRARRTAATAEGATGDTDVPRAFREALDS